MSNEEKEGHGIGEFASFELSLDQRSRTFTLILKGDIRFAHLVARKVDEIRVTESDLRESSDEGPPDGE